MINHVPDCVHESGEFPFFQHLARRFLQGLDPLGDGLFAILKLCRELKKFI